MSSKEEESNDLQYERAPQSEEKTVTNSSAWTAYVI